MADFPLERLKTNICLLSPPISQHITGAEQMELKSDICKL